MAAWRVRSSRANRRRSARARRVPAPSPAPTRCWCGSGVRRLPDRPPPRRGRSRPHRPRRRARPRGRRRGRRARAGRRRFALGDRVGIAWLRHTCGDLPLLPARRARTCASPPRSPAGTPTAATPSTRRARGLRLRAPRRVRRRGGRAAAVRGDHRLPRAAPRRVPPGGRLGIYGFGASAHLAAQVALHEGAEVHVLTRGEGAPDSRSSSARPRRATPTTRRRSRSTRPSCSRPSATWCRPRCAALDRGGTLAVAGHPPERHPDAELPDHLFQERTLRSVTANTRADGEEFLAFAAEIPIRPTATPYPFDAADPALTDLVEGRVTGAAVLVV